MSIGIVGIDHPVIAVRSMAESKVAYERLGFTVPPRGSHIEWGTGNWCIMFGKNYYELRGIVDAKRYTHGLEHFLEKREGQIGVAFRSDLDNRELYQRAIDVGLHPAAPRELTRNFELSDGHVPVSFRLVFFDVQEAPPLMASLVCEHLTPKRLRKSEYLEHANTATEVIELTSVVEELSGVAEQLGTLFGDEAIRVSDDDIVAALPDGGAVRILTRAAAARLGLNLEGVPLPYLTSVAIRVASLSIAKRTLIANGVPFTHEQGRLRIAPEHACGTYLEFAGT